MKIAVDDIKTSPKELSYTEEVDELNAQLGRGVRDYRFPPGLHVDLAYYRSGLDLLFEGAIHGQAFGRCSRCVEEYAFDFDQAFRLVMVRRTAPSTKGTDLSTDDMALSFYEGDKINMTPLVHEQSILGLPTRPLCHEGCRGLCVRCGANLNAGSCGCSAEPVDPRLAILHTLGRGK